MCPRLLVIGPFTLYSFGLMVILGFMAGVFLAAKLARERGLPGEAFVDGAIWMLFAGVAGARLLFIALNWRTYSADPLEAAAIWRGGMSFHGGAVAGVLAGVLFMRRQKLPLLAMADAAAPAMALGYAVGRIGCFLNGCCYGGPTDLPWGLHFPEAIDPHLLYHPAQIYASIINLGLAAALVFAYRRPHRAGQVMALYAGGYSVYRFFIEAMRKGVTAEELALGLTGAQVFSLFAIIAAAVWWFWLRRHAPPAPENPVPTPSASTVGSSA
jgi:phosphatidylglycerol---prolipoprotein diacylglyceryl transferase